MSKVLDSVVSPFRASSANWTFHWSKVLAAQSTLKLLIAIAVAFAISASLLHSQRHRAVVPWRHPAREVFNRTLGFQKVFVLSLPDRYDKRDVWALASTATGFDFEYVNGVKPDEIADKAIPAGWWREKWKGPTLACYRGHMNVIRRIVQDEIQTALIFEDDADWDVTLKHQLVELARGARFIQGDDTLLNTPWSPYGDAWDLLWLGHCGVKSNSGKDGRYFVVENDPTAPGPLHRREDRIRFADLSATELKADFTRVVHEHHNGRCAIGYAVSLQGARRMLHHFSVEANAAPWDRLMQTFCDNKVIDPNTLCITVTPSLMEAYHPAGDMRKDSDRSEVRGGGERKIGMTEHLVFPLKASMATWVDRVSGNSIWKSQHSNGTLIDEIDLAEFRYPRGKGLLLEATRFSAPSGYYDD